jgi:hypothetical protein
MKKLATIAVLATGALVLPAQAKPPHPTHPAHPAHPNKCAVHKVGYRAGGTLVSQSLTQTQGAATATKRDDRYSGSITVNIKKANHGAPTGNQTFTLTNAKLKFHVPDRNNDGKRTLADVNVGDRITLHGKITHLAKHCDHTGFTPAITVNRVDFNKPKPPKPAAKPHNS